LIIGSFLFPPDESPKKSRHGRTPSFQNLKKMASEFSLHRRSVSSSRSPEKQDKSMEDERLGGMRRSLSRSNLFGAEDVFSSLRGSKSRNSLFEIPSDEFGSVRSKKGVVKQTKLTKRVSDLEAKLDSARRELDRALGNVPPVPVLSPPSVDRRPLPRLDARHSDRGRSFVPALPTLLSESLLVQPAQHINVTAPVAMADILHSEFETLGSTAEASIKNEPLQESHGNGSLYMQQNQPLLKAEFEDSSPAKENVPATPKEHHLPTVPKTPSDDQTFLADPSSPRTETPKKAGKTLQKKTPAKKKRPAKADRRYRPGSEADDDAEWEVAKTQSAKKKRKSEDIVATTSCSPKRSRSSRLPVASDSPKAKGKKTNVLTKSAPAQKELPPTPATDAPHPDGTLETVLEELSFTNIIPVQNGSPRRPTATATPAFPHHGRGPSSSPSRGSPRRVRRVLTTPRRGRRESRSVTPPPSSTLGKFVGGMDKVMVARPDGKGVPAMPGLKRGLDSKSSFEWPEDVF
jgi:hypothetical protein